MGMGMEWVWGLKFNPHGSPGNYGRIFSLKKWCDLENRIRVRSMSSEMAPFDRSHNLL